MPYNGTRPAADHSSNFLNRRIHGNSDGIWQSCTSKTCAAGAALRPHLLLGHGRSHAHHGVRGFRTHLLSCGSVSSAPAQLDYSLACGSVFLLDTVAHYP